jgi:hypothetical protein
MLAKRLIKSNDGGGGACTDTVDLYNPFPDGGGVALYQLNGNATDVSGNYNGTATNVTYGTGVFGQAGVFNGSTSKVELPISVVAGNVLTVSLWFNSTSNNSPTTLFSARGSASSDVKFIISLNRDAAGDGKIGFDTGTSTGFVTLGTYAGNYNDGNWHHVVATINYTTKDYKVYIDGISRISGNNSSIYTGWNVTKAQIGVNNLIQYLNGSIDQVRMFNRALRPYEVEALYTEEYCTPTIVPSEHFNTVTYTGDNTANRQITDVGFQPDLVWIKGRTISSSHVLSDSVRGANLKLRSNSTAAEAGTDYGVVSAFSATGFSVDGTIDKGDVNNTGDNYVAWNFKAGGSALSNTDGTITSQVSANTEAGFSVATWTGNSVASSTIGHGLGVAPKIMIVKNRTTAVDWLFQTTVIDGSNDYLFLNTTGAASNSSEAVPTSTIYNLSGGFYGNQSANNYVGYFFAEVEGFSNFGSYVGTGTAGNPIVTGFEPAFVMLKGSSFGTNWNIFDNKRGSSSILNANLSQQEGDYPPDNTYVITENGFYFTGYYGNDAGQEFIYMAFAADPTTIEPSLEDSFNTVTWTGENQNVNRSISGVGFQPDLVWVKVRTYGGWSHQIYDSVRGAGANKAIHSNETGAEGSGNEDQYGYLSSFDIDGFTGSVGTSTNQYFNTSLGYDMVAWAWKGAELPAINSNGSIPSVVSANPAAGFSIVSYTDNASSGRVGHGLGTIPSVIIEKRRDSTSNWVYLTELSTGWELATLNETNAFTTTFTFYDGVNAPSDTTFRVGNPSGAQMITYCFAEIAGFSKFGSYTGNGSTSGPIITTGFEPAFVMIKCTSSADTNWTIWDNKRDTSNPITVFLQANNSGAEASNRNIDFNATSFQLKSGGINENESGQTYIYMAFANQF